jgi:hypothetical protein
MTSLVEQAYFPIFHARWLRRLPRSAALPLPEVRRPQSPDLLPRPEVSHPPATDLRPPPAPKTGNRPTEAAYPSMVAVNDGRSP